VIKPVDPVIRQLSVYWGATILGDGNVALVLDMPAIAHRAGMRNQIRRTSVEVKRAVASEPVIPGAPCRRRRR